MEKKAVLHARVSGRNQQKNSSMPTQFACMRQYAHDNNIEIVAETQDITSGRRLQRAGLDEALAIIESGKANILIVYQFDRLTRNYLDSQLVLRDLHQRGIELHYARSARQAGVSIEDQVADAQEAYAAELELEHIIERTTRGRAAKLNRGSWLGNGHVPYGYRTVGQGRTRTLVVEEAHAAIVRSIFRWFVIGDENNIPLGAPSIARKLTALGEPTPHDIRGWAHKKRAYAEWSAQSLYPILRQKAYIGKFVHNRNRTLPDGRKQRTQPLEWVEVDVPPILDDPDLWYAAQAKLDRNAKRIASRGQHNYLLAGRLSCICGYHLIGKPSIGGAGKPYLYYGCAGTTGLNAIPCNFRPLRVEKVDQQVWEWIQTTMLTLDAIIPTHEQQEREQAERQQAIAAQRRALLEERIDREQQIQRLLQLYARGTIPVMFLDAEVANCEDVIRRIDDRMSSLEQDTEFTVFQERIAYLKQISCTLFQRGSTSVIDFAAQRSLVELLDVRVRVARREDVLWLCITSTIRDDEVLFQT